jgi:hypothetical protein
MRRRDNGAFLDRLSAHILLYSVVYMRQVMKIRIHEEGRNRLEVRSLPGAGLEPAWGYPRGIFLPLQLSLLHTTARAFVVWTLPLPYRKRRWAPTT